MTTGEFTIRAAKKSDAKIILQFITELADFEKLTHEVVATEELISQSLFGNKPAAEALIGELGGKPVAFAIFFPSYSSFLSRPGIYLEDLYVTPAFRSRGFGKIMLTYIAKLAIQRGCARLEWAVLNWNKDAIRFYESLSAKPNSEWTVYRLVGETLARVASTYKG